VALTLKSFSAWRMTIKVVEPAVAHTHTATMAKPSTTAAVIAVNQIGVKKGRRWKLTWSFFVAP
jgi:hypothetical protein